MDVRTHRCVSIRGGIIEPASDRRAAIAAARCVADEDACGISQRFATKPTRRQKLMDENLVAI
ncbi:hypothetical protein NS365_04885 [Aureimonas ureilytica]|uniref:Uncharacterized protein n=1 Tax=Aureimonas ureilytica TaxID=401562 RepID=A0A175R7U0_9HYPH|nr:hypothetical protein NS365_23440 [Aureimonas ureilytica]KTR07159.1 hypothetical protein NS365_04885 [Aureimonas ureilytica]